MIKTVAYFPDQCALNSGPVMTRVLDCLQARGFRTEENSMDSDAAVIWSVLWHGRMARNELVYRHYRNQNKPVICIEVGALYRGTTWKIALNNITNAGFYGHKDCLDPDRPRKLGISLAYPKHTNPYILIAAQHNKSLQLEGVDQEKWITQQVNLLKQHTDRPIIVRPHPRSRLDTAQLPATVQFEIPHKLANTYDSFDMHFDCHAVVNYNSGPGIQAAISGVRPVVNSNSLAQPVSVDINNIEQSYTIDRESWLVELCHTEYTLDEIERGQWVERLMLRNSNV